MYHSACLPVGSWAEIARRRSLLIARASLAWAGSRHNKSSTLRQQQDLADILVQVPPNFYVACCRVGRIRRGSRGGGGWCTAAVPLVYVLVL